MLVELVPLFDVQLVILHEGVFAEISHIDVDFGLALPHIFVHFLHEEVIALRKSGVVLPDLQFTLLELSLDVENELLEVVFENELVDHRLMNLHGRELVLGALNDNSSELCEVLGNLGGTVFEYCQVLAAKFFEELLVLVDVAHEGFWNQFGRVLMLDDRSDIVDLVWRGLACLGDQEASVSARAPLMARQN